MYTYGAWKSSSFVILFAFVTKLQKLERWFDGNNEEKKRITSDAISYCRSAIRCTVFINFRKVGLKIFIEGG